MAVLKEVELTLNLAPEMEVEACEKACAVAEFMAMSPDRVDEVRMAVIEACINAIEHSSAEDGHLHIHIAVVGDGKPEALQVTVRDQGVGFDPEKLVQPKIEEKLKAQRKRGWGLKIIEGLMDQVRIETGADGTAVIMCKKLVEPRSASG
ncbi:MAG: ATP-binding protein [Acidobacteria bacterium]|nr:MAG: ATP-binding protein [Acidobacteriota bacterium]REK11779.1 MAG: ATP-binding protein [Acidobacteriota bacterium]